MVSNALRKRWKHSQGEQQLGRGGRRRRRCSPRRSNSKGDRNKVGEYEDPRAEYLKLGGLLDVKIEGPLARGLIHDISFALRFSSVVLNEEV